MARVLGDALAVCCTPFKGAAPYGEDVRYDPTFDTLRTEVQKLTALSTTEGGVDWETIKNGSLELLTGKSKDLVVASYLTLALFMRDGYPGLLDGLTVVDTFLRDHWESIFPPVKKMRSRAMAMEWLVDRVALFVGEREPEAGEAEVLTELRTLAGALAEQTRERLGPDTPAFGELLEGLSLRAQAVAPPSEPEPGPEGEAPPAPEPAAAGAAPAAAAPSTAAAAPPTSPPPTAPAAPPRSAAPAPAAPPAEATPTELLDHLLQVVTPLREAAPSSPVPYRLLRSLKWDGLAGPPPADPGSGKTRIPPPRPHQRTALDGLFGQGSWPQLLEAAEGAFQEPSGTFWLDLQRYTSTALERTGANRAHAIVKDEVLSLLERFSNIPDLTYSDGTPFASEATRTWLEQLRGDQSLELPAVSASAGDGGPALSQEEIDKAMALFADKSPAKAFAILQQGMERSQSPRTRFRTRLVVGRVCLQANQPAWARTLLEELVTEMGTFSFEQWERETAVEVLQLLAVCYGRMAKSRKTDDRDAVRDQLESIRSRLFRLDMRAAAAVDEMIR